MTVQRAHELHEGLKKGRNDRLADVLEQNIDLIELLRKKAELNRGAQDKFADAMTNWSGSMGFFYVHMVWFGVWIAINLGAVPGIRPFDPFPFGLLTMIVSLEAIFLSTFVLISQNRAAHMSEQQDDLDLQINILAEYEITRMLRLVDKIAAQMGIEDAYDEEIDQLCMPVAPDILLRQIELRHEKRNQ